MRRGGDGKEVAGGRRRGFIPACAGAAARRPAPPLRPAGSSRHAPGQPRRRRSARSDGVHPGMRRGSRPPIRSARLRMGSSRHAPGQPCHRGSMPCAARVHPGMRRGSTSCGVLDARDARGSSRHAPGQLLAEIPALRVHPGMRRGSPSQGAQRCAKRVHPGMRRGSRHLTLPAAARVHPGMRRGSSSVSLAAPVPGVHPGMRRGSLGAWPSAT